MLETIVTCTLAMLEMTFILVGLLILHGLRKVIGQVAFYISIGLLLVFTQLVSATELRVIVGYPGADFYIASSVLFLPYLTALMIVYVTEGTLATQRLIIGAMATLGLYIYLSHLTALQCNWPGYAISQGPTADSLDFLLRQSQRAMASSILAQTLDLFLIPIFFQRLRNLNCRMFIAVLGALFLTQIVDSVVYVSAAFWGQPQWWTYISSSYIAKGVATVWLSILATMYLTRIEKEIPGEGRGTLDIVFAFFGSYGKAEALQQHLREWEGRYRMVVENASDMILLLNQDGEILDANVAAQKLLRLPRKSKRNKASRLSDLIFHENGTPITWDDFCRDLHVGENRGLFRIHRIKCFTKGRGERYEFDMACTSIEAEGLPMLIVFGRDVTEESKLAREREDLRRQLEHTQRLESVGRLAGGVAHDFNNYIHAIQGHLDILKYMHDVEDDDVVSHLNKIDQISGQAATLTQQLLGFARKGKYVEKIFDLDNMVHEAGELFMPKTLDGLDFDISTADIEMFVRGDQVQLQQVLLNLLINASDAMEDNPENQRVLRIRVGLADAFACEKVPPPEVNTNSRRFFCIQVEDNGCGIPQEVLAQVFEPFFTTKPYGKGTGMGLAMAYGTLSNHGGWIQVDSKTGKGTSFYLFLPECLEIPEGAKVSIAG